MRVIPTETDLGGDAFGRWAQVDEALKRDVEGLILAVMPSGVGHKVLEHGRPAFEKLILAVMPSGVGHNKLRRKNVTRFI